VPRDRDNLILERLGEWKQRDGSLPQIVELYAQLLRLQVEVTSGLDEPEHPDLTESIVDSRIRQELPLLEFKDFWLDWDRVKRTFEAVVDALAGNWPGELEDAERLRNIASDKPLLQRTVKDWFKGLSLTSVATDLSLSEDILGVVIQATLKPYLASHAGAVLPLVNQELWRRRRCPVCGGKADFAYLEAEVGARWLLCSRCDAEWLYQRLECPYCGTTEQKSLAFLTDDAGVYRLYTCDECKCYIKAIDLRKAGTDVLLPLERVMTLDMDRQAVEAGYHPG